MSTGLECNFYEVDGRWYYLLQDWNCPVQAWDWREYATCYGPFKDFEEAITHLDDHHANPGGYSKRPGMTMASIEKDKVLAEAIKNARK